MKDTIDTVTITSTVLREPQTMIEIDAHLVKDTKTLIIGPAAGENMKKSTSQ
jgi:hypothetical protein